MSRPDRRTVIAATSAALLVAPAAALGGATHDEVREICLRYLALEDRVLDLLDEWPTLETRLAKAYPSFLGLPLEEQAQFPGGHRFLEIQDELDVLDIERDKLLPIVAKSKCRTVAAVIAKLKVVTRLIQPDDHPEAHKLVADSVKDLGHILAI